jgi:hypothetical protein
MSIDPKNEPLTIFNNWTATSDIFFEHLQGITINGQHPLAAVLLLFNLGFFYFPTAVRAKNMSCPKSCPAVRAGQLQTAFQVDDHYSALVEINIINLDRQSFTDPAA